MITNMFGNLALRMVLQPLLLLHRAISVRFHAQATAALTDLPGLQLRRAHITLVQLLQNDPLISLG